jgi:YidC/Oxa1 family membrane protein insertase
MVFFKAWSGWRSYRKLSADWRTIVFYSESGQDWHYFAPLIEVLNTQLQRKVTYVTSDPNDPGRSRQHGLYQAIYIPAGFFLTLHFQMQKANVVVLTMMDLNNLHLKKSINPVHYVYLFHSPGSTHMVDHANSYDAYDSLFCVGPHHVSELRKRESMSGLGRRNLYRYGHPRLDNLLVEMEMNDKSAVIDGSRDNPAPVILIAPTWGENSIFNVCGIELTGLLLNAGYRVIVRPHYQTVNLTPGVMEELKDLYAGHEHFEFRDQMGETESLHRSDILVCDWSAMAIEYALGLEKPVLFIDLPRRIRNPDWQSLNMEPLESSFREIAGDIVSPIQLEKVPGKIETLLDNRQEFRETIRKARAELVFNLGKSVEPGAREIARLADENYDVFQTCESC